MISRTSSAINQGLSGIPIDIEVDSVRGTPNLIIIGLASKAVEEAFANNHDIAAVIIEPIPANNGLLLQSPLFLQKLRELCTNYGSLLIFDEVISGFRVGFEGAAGHYQIKPDILTFGKIIGKTVYGKEKL